MITLRGKNLAESLHKSYLSRFKSVVEQLEQVTLQHHYIASASPKPTSQELITLETLLEAKQADLSRASGFWVMPRVGTQSSWSSKAMDVLKACELTGFERLEQLLYVETSPLLNTEQLELIKAQCYDRMTECVIDDIQLAKACFDKQKPKTFQEVNILEGGLEALRLVNKEWGLALSEAEMDYLQKQYQALARNPSDVELMMFAQVNSEHCRHKIFKAKWEVDGEHKKESLFDMIRNTSMLSPLQLWSAYHDNAAVAQGFEVPQLTVDPVTKRYTMSTQPLGIVMKVETHNHPTAIEPYAGAGTGVGGEIRDEGATGIGSKPKAGLTGFSVSHLQIPGFEQPYEIFDKAPNRLATSLDIMLKGPIGGAKFNNEFGRPNICGYFRVFEYAYAGDHYGYHKPIMIAGGLGQIRKPHVDKLDFPVQAPIIVLGGPALKIGLGGGAASSASGGTNSEVLDYASVQRQNPQMQRTCQEVIDALWALGSDNPVLSIHDVGAGGLCNAIPEIVTDAEMGAYVELRNIPNAEPGMSPLEIWCCEAQERYVMVVKPEALDQVLAIAEREHCPCHVVGMTTETPHLRVHDEMFDNNPVDVPLSLLLSDAPRLRKQVNTQKASQPKHKPSIELGDAIEQVIAYPTVASKSFLITIADRSVGGLVYRDQMVGPYQVPVADCGVTCASFDSLQGEAMAMGERAPIAVLNAKASCAMAVGEAITNIMSADVQALRDIKLSCNWMAASGCPIQDKALFDGVEEVGLKLCPALGIAVPVGKDSLSMKVACDDNHEVKSPLSLVVSAFAPVQNVLKSLTPELKDEPSKLLFVDLAKGKQRMGGSCYQQIQQALTGATPDVECPQTLERAFEAFTQCKQSFNLLAYHDKSDGGLVTTLLEMSFASRLGFSIDIQSICKKEPLDALLNEELGFVVQVREDDVPAFIDIFEQNGVGQYVHVLGKVHKKTNEIKLGKKLLYKVTRAKAQKLWSKVSMHMQGIRDSEQAAQDEFAVISQDKAGLQAHVPFQIKAYPCKGAKPKVAILREQGVNGQLEMAQAFRVAGFEAVDVTTSDLLSGRATLADFQVLAACGGFSYGDVLGAGRGWANALLHHPSLKEMMVKFFHRDQTLTLGVCNGCQMLSHLKALIPGADHWPRFEMNHSNQFEARLSLVKIPKTKSLILNEMKDAILPIVVSHGEGRVAGFQGDKACISMSYINPEDLKPTQVYPFNPNGSEQGVAAVTSDDGRATIMMPHPERVFRVAQLSWHPHEWEEQSPWQQMFHLAAKQFN